jgi:hypothetical protein
MAINPHHTTEMLEGKLCAVVEKGISQERASHICEILKASGFEVAIQEQNEKVTVGVTDILFNPVMAVYNRYLKTKDGRVVTPAIWSHNDSSFSDLYWLRR